MIQYKDKLKDSRWLAKRQAILARDSFRCVICGSNNGLNVHHSAYIYGREPWEYVKHLRDFNTFNVAHIRKMPTFVQP